MPDRHAESNADCAITTSTAPVTKVPADNTIDTINVTFDGKNIANVVIHMLKSAQVKCIKSITSLYSTHPKAKSRKRVGLLHVIDFTAS